jgi:uncharacterized membrane protein
MSGTRLPKSLFVVILGVALAECIRDFPLLPNRLASHFGPSGTPSGWLTKPQFFTLYAGLIVLAASVGFLAPLTIAKTPASKINLPYKEYWLAPERRAETLAAFERYFAWYGCIFLLLEVLTMQLVIQVNFRTAPRLPTGPILFLISAFVLFNIVSVITMFRRFSKPR